jgi:acetyl-CoA C-acetyltransferase
VTSLLDAYVYDAVRTPRGAGKPTGALAQVKPTALLRPLFHAFLERHPAAMAHVEDVVLGCSVQTGEQGANLAKVASLYAGLSPNASGVTLNRFCASGLDALAYAALKVSSGMESGVLAGGVESMSRVGMLADGGPWFADPEVSKATRFVHMGVSADLIATLEKISRAECDAYAQSSQERARKARDEGRFARSIVPVKGDQGQVLLDRDECIRDGSTLEKLSSLPPAFAELGEASLRRIQKGHPQVSAVTPVHHVGSSPAGADAASLVLVGNKAFGAQRGLSPRARIRAFANVGVDPLTMLTGPAPATHKALKAAGLSLADVDLVECNESFSATVLHFQRRLELDPSRVNVNGGAIALGHPLGATGPILVMTLLDELERQQKSMGVVTICAGAGIAEAMVLERV